MPLACSGHWSQERALGATSREAACHVRTAVYGREACHVRTAVRDAWAPLCGRTRMVTVRAQGEDERQQRRARSRPRAAGSRRCCTPSTRTETASSRTRSGCRACRALASRAGTRNPCSRRSTPTALVRARCPLVVAAREVARGARVERARAGGLLISASVARALGDRRQA